MDRLRGHLIMHRIALGKHQGKKAFNLQTLPTLAPHSHPHLAEANRFSLHAGMWASANVLASEADVRGRKGFARGARGFRVNR